MTPEPDPSFPHKTLWRKLRRRYFVDRLSLFYVLFVVPSIACSVAWISHGPLRLWFVIVFGILWAIASAILVSTLSISLAALFRRPILLGVDMRSQVLWQVLTRGAVFVALLCGHVDWAFAIEYGVSVAVGAFLGSQSAYKRAYHVAMALSVCLAFAAHIAWLVVLLLVLQFLPIWPNRRSLSEAIRLKPTRDEYVTQRRGAYAAGGSSGPALLLRTMCEVEMWEDALIELKRQSHAPTIRKNAAVWKAKIYLGMERYQEVLDLKVEAKQNACDITPTLAIAHARLGHLEKALHLAEEAHPLKCPGAEIVLGNVYFERKKYDEALQWYEAAAQDRSERALALRAIGKALMALGDYQEAAVAYEQSIRLTLFVRPEDLLQRADCLRKLHREREAVEMEQLTEEKA